MGGKRGKGTGRVIVNKIVTEVEGGQGNVNR